MATSSILATGSSLKNLVNNSSLLVSVTDSTGVRLSALDFDGNGAEMGFFFALSTLSVVFLLDQLNGRVFRMKIYLMNRDFSLVTNPHVIAALTTFIKLMSWFAISLPFLALGVWAAGLIARAINGNGTASAGITVALVGMSLFFFLLYFFRIKWNNYKFDLLSGIYLMLTFLCITAYQFVAVFMAQVLTSFGISAIFLSANGLVMLIIVFIQSSVKDGSIDDLIKAKIPAPDGVRPPKDPLREIDFDQEIAKEKDDKDFQPSTDDINDIFSIGNPRFTKKFESAAFSSGLQNFFANLNPIIRRLITLGLWILATGILVAYAIVIRIKFPGTMNLGWITLVALLSTDVLVYLIQNAEIIKTATPLAVTLFLNRFFLIVFGQYWVYGYILIYVCYGVLLSTIIAKKRFPLEDDVTNFDIDEIAAKLKAAKESNGGTAIQVQNLQAQKAINELVSIDKKIDEKLGFLKAPEYPMLIITAIYIIIFIVLSIIRPSSIPLPTIRVHSRDLHFFVAWAFLVVLVLAYFTSYSVILLFIRRKMGSSQKVYFELKNMCASKQLRLDRYWVMMFFNLATLISLGVISWFLTQKLTALILIVAIDLYLLCIMNFYTHFIANDYLVLQNIENVNIQVNQHNMRYDLLKKEIENAKKQIMQGGGALGNNQEGIERAKELIKKADEKKPTVNPQPQPKPVQPAPPKSNAESWDGEEIKKPQVNVQPTPTPKPQPQPPAPKPEPAKVQVNIKPPAQNPDEDLVNDEINMMNDAAREKGRKNKTANDGIYEGGEEEEQKIAGPADGVTELLVDPDEEEVVDQKTTKIKYKNVVDWRNDTNFFSAFWTGRLRKNDYQVIFSFILSLIVLAAGAFLVCLSTKDYVGITIFIPFLHYFLAAYSHMRTLSTDTPMYWFEYVLFFFAYFFQYGWGIFNLYLTYGFWNKNIVNKPSAGLYIVVNLIVIPFITTTVAAALKWVDSKGKITPFFIAQLVMSVLQGVGMLVCAYIYMTWVQGVIISCVVGVLGYIVFQVIIYVKNDNYMPRIWVVVNIVVVLCVSITTFVASFFVGELSIFMGFSISVWLFALLLLVFGISKIIYDIRSMKQRPIFFSPWVFPIYVFDPKKQGISSANLPAGSILTALVLLLFWSVLATAWFAPVHAGVALSILCEHLLIIAIMFFVQISHLQLHKLQIYIDKKIIKRAWLESKDRYLSDRNAFNRNELVTYEELVGRRNQMRNKMRILENRTSLSLEERFEDIEFLQNVTDNDLSWLNTNLVDMSQPLSQYSYLFDIEQDITKTYRLELELIVMFQLLIIAYTQIYHDQKKKYLMNFLTERRPYLLAVDIVVTIPPNLPDNVQYVKVVQQLQNLAPEQFQVFNDLREQFIQEMRVLDDQHREAAEAEEQKAADRLRQVADRQKKKQEGLSRNDESKPVDQWADCLAKWERIKREGKKFTDSDFAADASSLGNNVASRDNSLKWIRASEQVQDQRCTLYKDKVNPLDVIQGQLKDCYFLSAISILGEKNVEAMIKTTEDEWKKLGSFCVRFFHDGKEEFVIVDDFFPAKMENNRYSWAFCKGGDLGDELWPMVLEKAYAKLYGAYEYIEAGKVHYALADMIEGFPQQIDLKKDIKNTEVFWEKLKNLRRQGALMGAGSPENPLGDAAINQAGIVQGHAYALLDVQEVDEYKLIQLRNPHGRNGAEWRGDWSDSSANWNQRFKSKLKYEPRDHEDGVFWMDCDDFVEQYSYLYICRLMNEQMGWYKRTFNGEWSGASAEGLPNKKNPSAKLQLNPHYGVTITKPCDGFILLKQKEEDTSGGAGSTFKGKQSIFFMLTKNSGKRIMKVDTDSIVVRSGNPINLMSVSNDFEFDNTVSYPYTFTLLVANTEHGPAGEGTFELTVYSTDPQMTVGPMA